MPSFACILFIYQMSVEELSPPVHVWAEAHAKGTAGEPSERTSQVNLVAPAIRTGHATFSRNEPLNVRPWMKRMAASSRAHVVRNC